MQSSRRSWQFNRRGFLASTASALLVPDYLSIPCRAADESAKPPSSGLNLGFSLYGMKSLPLDEALETCAKIGYSHVEFALLDGFPTFPDVFSTEARQSAVNRMHALNLGLPCLMLNISLMADDVAHAKSLALIAQAGAMATELMPHKPPILETVLGGKPTEWENQKTRMADRLNDWAQAAEKAKTIIAIKAHVNSGVNSPERLLWLLDQVKSPAIEAAYDYSHFELQGIDMEESLKALLPRTKFIHVKDTTGDAQKFQFLLPGEGRTDYVKYFSLLKRHGYSGPVCVEVSAQIFTKPGYDPIAAATKSYSAMSAALAQI